MSETARVVAVPGALEGPLDLTPRLRRPGSTAELRPIQSKALRAIEVCQGGLFPIGVGHGKTLIALLAGTMLGAELTVILTKASVVAQMDRDYKTWCTHFRLPRVRLLSYPALSRPERSEELSRLAELHGDRLVIVADEAHELKRFTSARTKRVSRLLTRYPSIRFVALSGTITTRSVRDYAHLSEWALRHNSPVPRSGEEYRDELDTWCRAFDPDGRPNKADWDTVWPVLEAFGPRHDCPACHGTGRTRPPRSHHCEMCAGSGNGVASLVGEARQAYAQKALQARLHNCQGVVATTDGSIGASLIIHTIEPQVPDQLLAWLALIDSKHENPDGEILPDDLSRARARRNLSAGFYQRWEWGERGPDKDWLNARKGWNMHVSDQLDAHSDDGYDSPLLVWRSVQREVLELEAEGGTRYQPIHDAWMRWERQRHKRPPPSVAEWYSTFLIDALVDLLGELHQAGTPCIVWYESRAVEIALREIGLRVYGAGSLPPDIAPDQVPPTVAMSIRSHGTGRNLQAWACNVIVEPPADAGAWEQLLGRTHRQGQLADEVTVYVFAHEAFGDAIESARGRAAYIQNSTGNSQKLLLASWQEHEPTTGGMDAARAA